MPTFKFKSVLLGGACAVCFAAPAAAESFNIPGGDLENALNTYVTQTGVHLIVSEDAIKGIQSRGVKGDLPADQALSRILAGSGFTVRNESGVLAVVRGGQSSDASDVRLQPMQLAQAAQPRAAVETVTVTSSKLGGADVQSIPISITALSQEQLTATQTAGGPDLVKQVPNLTFTKTNFTGYSIQIRGIGTQAISVTTDPAVAVALNDIPFIRNHFFEQEFYDLSQAEVLRGPQGTLYGRNATAGVVNLVTAKPTDQFEALASVDIGDYKNRRFEGMINVPLVDDRVDLRIAGEWTKRDGYSFNDLSGQHIDGRDLWSGRVSLSVKPVEHLQATLVWEHFSENDDRMRTSKQLCKTAEPPTSIDGQVIQGGQFGITGALTLSADYLSQGCEQTSLYSPQAFQVPYGFSLPYAVAAGATALLNPTLNPYASTTQSQNLRVIESALSPHYTAKNDTLELNAEYAATPALTLSTQTGFNQDFLHSTEDYNRFNTSPGIFVNGGAGVNALPDPFGRFLPDPSGLAFCDELGCDNGLPSNSPCTVGTGHCAQALVFCDPQLGCSNRLVGEDLSEEHAWQFSQELRLTSSLAGPLNFSVGGNYLHYETEENYYVFINALSAYATRTGSGGNGSTAPTADHSDCLQGHNGAQGYGNWNNPLYGGGVPLESCLFIDVNPIGSLNNNGHNYFLSQNPYKLDSYAVFGEVYYNITNELKLIGGLRWTDDRKHFVDIPSEVVTQGYGYPITAVVDQQWGQFTGRATANWTPKLDFTGQTLIYGTYARGYKAGGANPPGAALGQAILDTNGSTPHEVNFQPIHPLTFKPEFVNAFELGTKNTLFDGALTLNGDVFYYDYKNYQISEIVDRTAINLNFNAKVKGAEIEASWEPTPGLTFNFAGGYENTRIANGQSSIDLMDRTAGTPGWMVVKPFATQASNCILPTYVVAAMAEEQLNPVATGAFQGSPQVYACEWAYNVHLDPGTLYPYAPNPTGLGGVGTTLQTFLIAEGYPGFDPATAPNQGEGFAKDLSGNELPNAPPFTISIGAQFSMPLTSDWAGTARVDYYWQDYSWARVFNDNPYDRLRGYTNVNLALILTSQSGWQVICYLKNVFNTTAITGDFLNSDDSGLTTNVFLTDPRLYGVRITKNF